jgi:uncharacterized membrane protein
VSGSPITVAGIELPSDSPAFLTAVGLHVAVGIVCVGTGLAAMLSQKRAGLHPMLGSIYYWCLSMVFASATALSVVRWAENYHLFTIGVLSFAAASLGRAARRRRWHRWARFHIVGMGLSYVLLLTAFYVDNGRNLPLWNHLPPIAYWVLPAAIGTPLIARALLRNRLAR